MRGRAPKRAIQRALSHTPEARLRKARGATRSALRAKYALMGLQQAGVEAETRWLLLRQLYLSHLEMGAHSEAIRVTRDMLQAHPPLADVAHHDAARAGLGARDWSQAAEELALAFELAPPERTSLHGFALARLYACQGKHEQALAWLGRSKDRVLSATPEHAACVVAAELVWRQSPAVRQREGNRALMIEAYDALDGLAARPVLADFFAAQLLVGLGSKQAEVAFQQFLAAVDEMGFLGQLGLMPEIVWSRQWLALTSEPRQT